MFYIWPWTDDELQLSVVEAELGIGKLKSLSTVSILSSLLAYARMYCEDYLSTSVNVFLRAAGRWHKSTKNWPTELWSLEFSVENLLQNHLWELCMYAHAYNFSSPWLLPILLPRILWRHANLLRLSFSLSVTVSESITWSIVSYRLADCHQKYPITEATSETTLLFLLDV